MATFNPSILGIFIFGLIPGICPCNSVLCLGLIGYLTSGNTQLSLTNILKLTLSFCMGTVVVLLPLGLIAGFIGKYLLFLNSTIAWAIGGVLLILMGLQLLQIYKPPIREHLQFFKVPDVIYRNGCIPARDDRSVQLLLGEGRLCSHGSDVIPLYQTAFQGFFTMLIYAIGLSIPLIVISPFGGYDW